MPITRTFSHFCEACSNTVRTCMWNYPKTYCSYTFILIIKMIIIIKMMITTIKNIINIIIIIIFAHFTSLKNLLLREILYYRDHVALKFCNGNV